MPEIEIRPATVDEIVSSDEFARLCRDYHAESCMNPDLYGDPDVAAYAKLVEAGLMRVIGAFDGGTLVGFATVLLTPVLHYSGKFIATVETIYLAPPARGAPGLRLLQCAEDVAREAGADGLYVSAPVGSRLQELLPRLGFKATNVAYYHSFTAH